MIGNEMVGCIRDHRVRQAPLVRDWSFDRMVRVLFALLLVSGAVVPAAAGDDPSASNPEDEVQISRAAAIDMGVRFDNVEHVRAGEAEVLVFSMSLDTHVVNLFRFDLETLVAVYLDGEPLEADGIRWTAESETSHHRFGTLHVPIPARLQGTPIGGEIELRIRDVGTEQRVFSWT